MKKSYLTFLVALLFVIPITFAKDSQAEWYRRSGTPESTSTENGQEQYIEHQGEEQAPPDEQIPMEGDLGSEYQQEEGAGQQTDEIFEQQENQEPAK